MGIHMLAKLQKSTNSGPPIICNILKKSSTWSCFFSVGNRCGNEKGQQPPLATINGFESYVSGLLLFLIVWDTILVDFS